MITALKELGEYLRENEGMSVLDSSLTINKLQNIETVICLDFEREGNNVAFVGIHTEPMDNTKAKKILYSSGSSRGGDNSPTSILSSTVEKVLRRIFEYGWFKKYSEGSSFLEAVKAEYETHAEVIKTQVEEAYQALSKEKKGCVVTLKIKENGNEKFIHAFPEFCSTLEETIVQGWERKHSSISKGKGYCMGCESPQEVYGFAFPYAFYTVDKKGFAPDFDQSRSWEQLPLCKECGYSLLTAAQFLRSNDFSFFLGTGASIRYYIIPEFPLGSPEHDIFERITMRDSSVEKQELAFISAEDFYSYWIANQKPTYALTLIFIFYSTSQSRERIHKIIADVPPSWIKTLTEVQEGVESLNLFQEESLQQVVGSNWEGSLGMGNLAAILRNVLPSSEELADHTQHALDLAASILKGEEINEKRLIRLYNEELQRRFRQEENLQLYALHSFLFLLFLYKAHLTKERGDTLNMKETKNNSALQGFFSEYREAFGTSERKAAFAEGVLTRHLLDVQYAMRNSTPFRGKLRGLRLNPDRLKQLLTEIEEKFAAYEVAYPDLQQEVAELLLAADANGWDIDGDELSYFFTLGLNLGRKFKTKKEEQDYVSND